MGGEEVGGEEWTEASDFAVLLVLVRGQLGCFCDSADMVDFISVHFSCSFFLPDVHDFLMYDSTRYLT